MASVAHLHKLVARNARLFRAAWQQAARHIQHQLPASIRPTRAELQPILAKNGPRHPLHRVAFLKQSKGRWYTTHSTISATVRRFTASARASGVKFDRAALPKSQIGTIVTRQTGRAPFASTLRPNLTGGTLNRTAGGYAWGSGRTGGARYFSHGPAAPAQVITNVSQAVRAFVLGGNKAQFDGVCPHTGEKRYKSVSALRSSVDRTVSRVPKASPGSFISFSINPTVTALSPLQAVTGFSASSSFAQEKECLNQEGLLDVLSADFSRAVKELAAVLNDLQRLAGLGDLPLSYSYPDAALKVHFPGCDAQSVEALCDELGVQRGVVHQDEEFDAFVGTEIALLFPFAPSEAPSECDVYERPSVRGGATFVQQPIEWREMMDGDGASEGSSLQETTSDPYSTLSEDGLGYDDLADVNPWEVEDSPYGRSRYATSASLSSPSGYGSFQALSEAALEEQERVRMHTPLEYQGIEGIYRFMEQCDPRASR